MATTITPANVDFGMYRNVEVRKPKARSTITPVMIPPAVVFTPEALLTAVLVKEPVMGID